MKFKPSKINAMSANAKAAVQAFAHADRITAAYGQLTADEWDAWVEFPRYANVLAFEHAYSTSYYAMSDGTICAKHDNALKPRRYLVDWRTW